MGRMQQVSLEWFVLYIKKAHFWILAFVLAVMGVAVAYWLQPSPQPTYNDQDVRTYYDADFRPKYERSKCEVWIDYRPQRNQKSLNPHASIYDLRMLSIVEHAVLKVNKYMLFFSYTDMGGTPGLHLMFADFCEDTMELGNEIAHQLVTRHPYITEAQAVRHTTDRDQYVRPDALSGLYVDPQQK